MVTIARCTALPPVYLPIPPTLQDALTGCAAGESPPDLALLQLLVVSPSEEAGERALGTAIWDALENRETPEAERLGAVQKLWDGARDMVHAAGALEPGSNASQASS